MLSQDCAPTSDKMKWRFIGRRNNDLVRFDSKGLHKTQEGCSSVLDVGLMFFYRLTVAELHRLQYSGTNYASVGQDDKYSVFSFGLLVSKVKGIKPRRDCI